ncbi:extended synaptotagmin-3 isoform X1 [Oreochromis niloticus]|uniref:extended synaptotagmin-3 isoform X1 n=1 Tax=Oreochromis niloticus TaxID=8128 RepID=UPI0009051373|nr:extended synaptotagmin-3 isoform X1 [Oreochromis niloticus]
MAQKTAESIQCTDRLGSSTVNHVIIEFVMYCGRAVFICYPVYLLGYLGINISWVLLCVFMLTYWKKNRQWKVARITSAIELVDNEKRAIKTELRSALPMASWVQFSDVEKVHWLNKVLKQAWPFFGTYMEKLLRENIQQSIRFSSPSLKTFTFTKIHFGRIPLKITGIRAYTHEVEHREVILDMNISYDGDVDIRADVNSAMTAGVKGVKLHGMMRVILEPLIGQTPLVGGVTFFFIRRPVSGHRFSQRGVVRSVAVCLILSKAVFFQTLKINWTGMTNLLSSPAFSSLSDETIMNIIASFIVLPNRMCIPLIDQVKMEQMRFPLPRGVVRVHLLEARDLLAMDTYVMGLVKGKSDPYATLRVGNIHFKSKTVKKNLHPRWNEVYEFVVHEAPGQELEVGLYDEDVDKDDFLGSYNLDLGEVKSEKQMDQWFPLEDVPHGEVHLKLQWFSLQTDTSLLQESNDDFACAILAVYLDNATDLPNSDHQRFRKNSKEAQITKRATFPNSFVEFSIDSNVQKSKVVYASKDPVWEEGFTFFVRDVNVQQLFVQVKEPEKKNPLGVLNLLLSRLLNTSDLTLDEYFLLEHSGANSQIKLKATLRILKLEEPPPKTFINPSSEVKQQQARKAGNTSVSSPSDAPSSSHTVSSNNTPGPSTPNQETASPNQGYLAQGRGSFQASKKRKSSANVRRFTSHSLLSQNSITSSSFDPSDEFLFPDAIRNHRGSFGEIELNVRYVTLKHKLIVFIIRCRNLFPCSENGTDSYVRLYLLPDQTWKHRKKTHVKKRMINPVFNEKFEFDVLLQEAQNRKLDVSVKNNSILVSLERKDIGSVIIDLSEMDLVKGVTAWYDLTLPEMRNSM